MQLDWLYLLHAHMLLNVFMSLLVALDKRHLPTLASSNQ